MIGTYIIHGSYGLCMVFEFALIDSWRVAPHVSLAFKCCVFLMFFVSFQQKNMLDKCISYWSTPSAKGIDLLSKPYC